MLAWMILCLGLILLVNVSKLEIASYARRPIVQKVILAGDDYSLALMRRRCIFEAQLSTYKKWSCLLPCVQRVLNMRYITTLVTTLGIKLVQLKFTQIDSHLRRCLNST